MNGSHLLYGLVPLTLGLLCACRQDPGNCSGRADRLCVRVELGTSASAPDQLVVSATAMTDTGSLQTAMTLPNAAAAFRGRQHYTFELDENDPTGAVQAAQRIDVRVADAAPGAETMSGSGTWQRQSPVSPLPIVLDLLHPPGGDLRMPGGEMGPGGEDLRPPGPAWTNGMSAAESIPATNAGGLKAPFDVCWNGVNLFVSDSGYHRVLVFDSFNGGAMATKVIGSTDFTLPSTTAKDPPDASSLNTPRGLWCDQRRLFVADSGNNRVIFYDLRSLAPNDAPGEGLVGQPSASANGVNRGGGPNDNTLNAPAGVFLDGSRLFIADSGNNRVVGYVVSDFASLPSAHAQILLGQTNFLSAGIGGGDAGLSRPQAVFLDGKRLAVVDKNNSRVVVYNDPAGTTNHADAALGQPNLTGTTAGHTATTLSLPGGLRVFGGQTFVADTENSRVLIYNQGLPGANMSGTAASFVIGRAHLDDPPGPKQTGPADLFKPAGVFIAQAGANTVLIVADTQNNRVQIFRAM